MSAKAIRNPIHVFFPVQYSCPLFPDFVNQSTHQCNIICCSNCASFLKVVDEDYSMCIPKNTSHNFSSQSMQKLFRIAAKIGLISLQNGHMKLFLVDCEQLMHPSCTELSHPQMCMQNLIKRSVEVNTISDITRTFTFGSFKTILWILLVISGVVISFG